MTYPPFYDDPEVLNTRIEEYFAHCDAGEEVEIVRRNAVCKVRKAIPYTVPDLAVYLGYASRQSVWDLRQNPALAYPVERALARIQGQRVRKALTGEQDSRFAQFDLINNFKYTSSKEVVTNRHEIVYSDDELRLRLESLEGKVKQISKTPDTPVIEGEFTVKLLE